MWEERERECENQGEVGGRNGWLGWGGREGPDCTRTEPLSTPLGRKPLARWGPRSAGEGGKRAAPNEFRNKANTFTQKERELLGLFGSQDPKVPKANNNRHAQLSVVWVRLVMARDMSHMLAAFVFWLSCCCCPVVHGLGCPNLVFPMRVHS